MPDTYKITPEQEAILATFTCERLKDDENNRQLIEDFFSRKGSGLVNSLLHRGWDSDNKGTIAYYVVKNAEGTIVLFFSLKCGVLFDPSYVQRVMGLIDETELLRKALFGARQGDEDCIRYLRDEVRRLGDEEFDRRVRNINALTSKKNTVMHSINLDKRGTPHNKVIRVDETHPAIELVDFCVNDVVKKCWPTEQMGGKKMGRTMFWKFIVPKMLEISQLVGCEYAYFFAADRKDGKLIQYYRNKLHFREPERLDAIKPYYDMTCILMCKNLFTGKRGDPGPLGVVEEDDDEWGLDSYQQDFFDHFNRPDPEENI